MDSSTTSLWTSLFPIVKCLVIFLLLLHFIEIPVVNTNSVDPNQMLHSAASDLGLHCLPIALLEESKLKWIKGNGYTFQGTNRSKLTCLPSEKGSILEGKHLLLLE